MRVFQLEIDAPEMKDRELIEAIEKAAHVLSERVWANCSTQQPWSLRFTEHDQLLVGTDYEFVPEEEESDEDNRG